MSRPAIPSVTLAALVLCAPAARGGDDPEPLARAARYPLHGTVDPTRSGPIETRRGPSGHLWVKPLVNGKDVGWFMFDTGKTGMSIDPGVAHQAKGRWCS